MLVVVVRVYGRRGSLLQLLLRLFAVEVPRVFTVVITRGGTFCTDL